MLLRTHVLLSIVCLEQQRAAKTYGGSGGECWHVCGMQCKWHGGDGLGLREVRSQRCCEKKEFDRANPRVVLV